MTPDDYLARYAARGWRTVPVHRPDPATGGCSCGADPCPTPGKHPVARSWPGGSADPADYAGRNVGVRLGPDSGGIADVDLDCPEAEAAAPHLLPPTGSSFGRGGRVTHRLYAPAGGGAAYAKLLDPVLAGGDGATLVELRWPSRDGDADKALQTVVPPSLHASGEILEWAEDGEPAAVPGADLAAAVRHVGAAALLARYARPAERHQLVLLAANLLARAGWAGDGHAVRFIIAVFAARHDPDKVAKVITGEGRGAVADARERLTSGRPMKGLPELARMLDPALTRGQAGTVVARVAEWLGLPDSPGPKIKFGGPGGGPPDWEAVVPLPDLPPAPAFPVRLFPPKVADYWAAAARALHVPVDYVAGPSLAVLGAAVGRARAAEVKDGYAESPLFWIVNVAPPGATKSASLAAGRGLLDDEESRWRREYAAAVELFDAEAARYEQEFKEWKKNPGGSAPPAKPRRPTLRQAVLDDTTVEAARRVLAENPRGVVLIQDELIGFGRMLNQYKAGGKGNDKTFWLSVWNGKGLAKNNRAKDHLAGPLVNVDGFGAVAGMLCPDSLPELREELQRGGAANDGWCARFLFQYPEPLPAVEESWAVVPGPLAEGYREVVLALLGLEMVPVEDPARETRYRPYFARFDDGVRRAWSAFTREVADRVNALPRTDGYRGVLSKLKHYGLRFACLFHCLDLVADAAAAEGRVAAACMERAAALVWYYEAHGRRCLGVGDRATDPARRLLDVLRAWGGDRFSKRELHRRVRGQTAFRQAEALDAPLRLLCQHGYVAPEDASPAPGRPSERFRINPLWDRSTPGDTDNTDKTPGPPGDPGDPGAVPAHGQNPPDMDKTRPEGSGAGNIGHVERDLSTVGHATGNPTISSEVAGFVRIVRPGRAGNGVERGATPPLGMTEGGGTGSEPPAEGPGYMLVTDRDGVGLAAAAVGDDGGPVGLDCETTGLDPLTDRVRLVQVSTSKEVFVLDLSALGDPAPLAGLFDALARAEVVGHNLQFDLRFLARLGFEPGRVFDTQLASQLLHAGNRPDGENGGRTAHTLAAVVRRELGRELAKDLQASDWSGRLTPGQLAYAAADAAVLLPLAEALRAELAAARLADVAALEMRALCGVAWAGPVTVDTERWRAAAEAAAAERDRAAAEMDALVPNPGCLTGTWEWGRPAQVRAAFARAGVALAATDKAAIARVDHPLAAAYKRFKTAKTLVDVFGLKWLAEHAAAGRVAPRWFQIGADSGRMACRQPNLQQLPKDRPEYRRCVVARPGHVLVAADYSQIELRIAARVANERAMLDAYRRGEDLHALTAARVLGKPAAEVSRGDRKLAKALNFGLLYGMGAPRFRAYAREGYGVELTEDQAVEYRARFFDAYPGLLAWHRRVGAGPKDRPVDTRTLLGRRRRGVARFTERLNTPVQGSGADGLKAAVALLWERRADCPGAVPVLFVHDEVVVEAPEDRAERAAGWLRAALADAMAPLIDPVPVEVEVAVGPTWGG